MGGALIENGVCTEIVEDTDWEDVLLVAHNRMVSTSVPAILEFAKEVAAFKADCQTKQGGTDFSEKVQEWLGMSQPIAEKWARIGSGSNLFTLGITSLPPSMSTIYQLTTLSEEVIEQAIEEGKIHPEMTRQDVQSLKPEKQKPTPKPPSYEQAELKLEALAEWIAGNFNRTDRKSLAKHFTAEVG